MGLLIDTLQFAKGLEEAGMAREAAKLQARALSHALEHAAQNRLATKEDLQEVHTELKEDINKLELKMNQMEVRLTNR